MFYGPSGSQLKHFEKQPINEVLISVLLNVALDFHASPPAIAPNDPPNTVFPSTHRPTIPY